MDNLNNTDRPWTQVNQGSHSNYFGLSYGKFNSNVVFAPGLDRFILTDNYDVFTVYEAAKLLSSKIATHVYVLGKTAGPTIPERWGPRHQFNSKTCIEYTFADKSSMKILGSSIITAKQTPLLSRVVSTDAIIYEGYPVDYDNEEGRATIAKLQDFARFVLRALYAIKIADASNNVKPASEILDYFDPAVGKVIKHSPDHTYSEYGMLRTIKTILYHADTVETALSQIEQAMQDAPDQPLFRNKFYEVLGIPVPESVANIKFSGRASPWAIA